jgi:hypothetical protein
MTDQESSGGLGAEEALEAGASELHTDEVLAVPLGIGDVDDAALRQKVGFVFSRGGAVDAARGVVRKRDADFEVGAEGDVMTSDEGGTAAAKIFAGSFFFEDDAALVAAAYSKGEANGDPTFGALPRPDYAERRHAPGPRFQ